MIRLADPDEFDDIWPLLRDAFRAGETYAVDPLITKEQAFAYWMVQPAATYVFDGAEGVVGTYYIKTNQPGGGSHICNCGYIVSPKAQGQGIAAQMCIASQAQAAKLGYLAMQFNFVLASNTRAVKLWHRLGYQTVGTIPKAFHHPREGYVDALVMHKQLSAD